MATVAPKLLPAAGDAIMVKCVSFAEHWGPVAHRSIPFSPIVDGDVLHSCAAHETRGSPTVEPR
ncbi:hypothetical protein [Streptomyces sp. NPDC001340]